ncbi:MAG: YceI family protein [Cyclobacteriaceae bacterium]|nr:YceI family protein [Cyclobacteriaceae bacterium]
MLIALAPGPLTAQKFISETSRVTFFSKATIEDIAAVNEKSIALFDAGSGDIAFSVPVKEFTFEKSLMREHFNEKYMETEKYPKATFQGKVTGYSLSATGPQPARAAGKLTVHGVTRDVEVAGTLEVKGDRLLLAAKFMVTLEDYKVKRPQVLWKNIAEAVEVTVDFTFKPNEK